MVRRLILYGTAGCHLCDLAEAVTSPIAQARGILLLQVDIAGNPELEARYDTRIPVLQYGETELNWPFDAQSVLHLLLS